MNVVRLKALLAKCHTLQARYREHIAVARILRFARPRLSPPLPAVPRTADRVDRLWFRARSRSIGNDCPAMETPLLRSRPVSHLHIYSQHSYSYIIRSHP